MPNIFKLNALIAAALAVSFYIFFMAAKHDPALSAVSAFGEDPFDAIGSFGIQAAAFLAILSLVRAFRPYPIAGPTDAGRAHLARTQLLAALAVIVTLGGDVVAMARYSSVWTASADGVRLAALLAGLALLATIAARLAVKSVKGIASPADRNLWGRAAAVCLVGILILVFYPEHWKDSTPGALFTVVAGEVLLFAPMWAIGAALLPYRTEPGRGSTASIQGWMRRYKSQLGSVVIAGIVMGLLLVLAELGEPGSWPNLAALAFVASIYVGLETSGLLMGYFFLRNALGLAGRDSR